MDVLEYAQNYARMSDDELTRIYADRGSLVQEAIEAIEVELARRGLAVEDHQEQSPSPTRSVTASTWTKPSHHTKQKRKEYVALSNAALDLLRAMAEKKSSDCLFPGIKDGNARTTLRRPWAQVCKAAGLVELRIHDLRHNFASYLVSSGVSLHIVGKLLGHTQPQTTARYAHLADDPLREAANRFPVLGK